MTNADPAVIRGFGDEWSRYDQAALTDRDLRQQFDDYFHVFPWGALGPEAEGADIGCGSGRWAKLAAPRVGKLYCVDPSPEALAVAQRNLKGLNCEFQNAAVSEMDLPQLDFA